MSHAFFTEKQMPYIFLYYSTCHTARMMNMIPGKLNGDLDSLFLLVQGVPADCCACVPLFSVYYFHHNKDSNIKRSKNQANASDRNVVGRSSTSNTLLVYNPWNKKFHKPDTYHVDRACTPSATYPMIKYDGGVISASPTQHRTTG